MKNMPLACIFALLLGVSVCNADSAPKNAAQVRQTAPGAQSTVSSNPPARTTPSSGHRSEDAARIAIESREPLSVPGVPNGVLKSGMDYIDLRRAILARG